jgi:hypothetical protein
MKAIINIPLPFKLPFKEGLKVVSGYENNKYFSIELEHYNLYLSEDMKNFDEINNTQLIVTYVNDDKDLTAEVENLLRGIIYNCLGYVNNFLTSIRFTLDLNYVKDITVYDLPDYLNIEVDGNTYIYITSPMKLFEESEILPSKKLQLAQKMMATWEKYPEVALVDRFYSNAKHSIETENFLSAVIELQTSFEIFIRNTMRLIVKIDGQRQNRSQIEIEKEIEEKKIIAFRNLIEQHLSKKLGEKLDFFKHPVVYKWYKHLYKIRNDIVHSGKYFVTNEEAQAAYDSYVEVRNYIADKLVEKKYLSEKGNVDLKLFEEVYSNPKIHEEIRRKLEKYNLLPKDLEFLHDNNK